MITLNKQQIVTEQFPNNETKIKDFESIIKEKNLLEFTYREDGDLIRLMFVKRRIEEKSAECVLVMNYMPYSRMDRKIDGDLFTLQYVCRLINDLNFSRVYVIEPHSSKTTELLERSEAIYPAQSWLPEIMSAMSFTDNDRIVFPDKGAASRYKDCNYNNICIFEKTRNPLTGQIENMILKEGSLPQGAKCIIVDDLCSAGGTFAWAGNILKDMGASDVRLVVTHCEPTIFSGKLLDDNSPIDLMYTSRSMMDTEHPKINYIKVNIENYV